ncbi:MAG: homoserine dehydrogenase [Thermodesulfobacteria bacterium]|nr:homoserine dehydrogenase [Thermodesulfobacteriota bacterium]
MKDVVNVGIVGFGTVGSGTAKILLEQRHLLEQRASTAINLKWICDKDITTDRGFPVPENILTTDINTLLDDPELDIFVELIGGIEPAKTFILKAIEKGKHVVTANKALLATHGFEIFEAAAKKGVEIGIEASVGGGIPCIKALKEGLVANNVNTVLGIMNGTANYILTRMTQEGLPFQEVLKQAQELGYAEADPTYDVEGIDTAHKLAIMSTLAFGKKIELSDIYTEGISKIEPMDISFATELGYSIKLLAIGKKNSQETIDVRIHPTMIPQDHLLSQVNGAFNAVYFVGDSVGKVMLYGMGAGQMPTGSAIVADVVDIARDLVRGCIGRVPALSQPFDSIGPASIKPVESVLCKYYFRFSVKDKPGVLAKISGILGKEDISIHSVVQKGRAHRSSSVPIVMLTHEAREGQVKKALKEIDSQDFILDETMIIRIEDMKALEES